MNSKKAKRISTYLAIFLTCIFTISVVQMNQIQQSNIVQTSATATTGVSNKKIEWGIKRGDNDE